MNEVNVVGSDTSPSDSVDTKIWKVAAVVMMGPFMTQLDSTVVNVSLSTVQHGLEAPISSVQWVISGYLLALALMLPLNGWLVDRVGTKRLYLGSFSAFTLASFLCGAAQTMGALICSRVLQGMAGGLLSPMAQMMVAKIAGKQMARVMGYSAVPILIAPILGPIVAGTILRYASWRYLFFLNLPIGTLATALAAFLLPGDHASPSKRPFDAFGFMMFSPGLACLLYGLERVSHGEGSLILVTGLILTGMFIWHAIRKMSAALIDLRLFKNRILSTAAMTQFLSNGQMYAGQFLIPLFLISGCGLSAAQVGWMLAATGFGMMCSFPMIGFLTERFGCRAVSACGAFLAFLGMLPFLWMIEKGFLPILAAVCLFFRGAGQGAIGIPSVSAAYTSIPREKLAIANTAINIIQRLGGPLATTVTAFCIPSAVTSLSTPGPHAFTIAFSTLIGLHLLALGAASRLPALINRDS